MTDDTSKTPDVAPPAPAQDPFERAMEILRKPFPAEQIGRLPRQVKKDDPDKMRCEASMGRAVSADGYFCGGYHARSVHLSYVGHAALTARLLDADPRWSWEPVAFGPDGLPVISGGGLWIRLTVAGVTRLGYGDAPGKRDATKELIGDALRNAAMRFGAALDLWSKEDLRAEENGIRADEPPVGGSQGNGGAPASSSAGTAPNAQAGAQGRGPMPEEAQSRWRTHLLSIEYLGNRVPKEPKDGGLRTAYQEAKEAGILPYSIAPNDETTFVQLLQRLSRELPERPNEKGDTVPPDESEEQRVERETAEAEREAMGRPMALGGDDPWASDPGAEAGWGNTGAGSR